MSEVALHIYDLSMGMARTMAGALIGFDMEYLPHTGIVCFGYEYFYGGGMQKQRVGVFPRTTGLPPCKIITLGRTNKSQAELDAFIQTIRSKYSMMNYDLFHNNCNHASNDIALFLLGPYIPTPADRDCIAAPQFGIPSSIVTLPQRALQSPFGAMIAGLWGSVGGARSASMGTSDPFAAAFAGNADDPFAASSTTANQTATTTAAPPITTSTNTITTTVSSRVVQQNASTAPNTNSKFSTFPLPISIFPSNTGVSQLLQMRLQTFLSQASATSPNSTSSDTTTSPNFTSLKNEDKKLLSNCIHLCSNDPFKAMPSVITATEAESTWRKVHPHPDFISYLKSVHDKDAGNESLSAAESAPSSISLPVLPYTYAAIHAPGTEVLANLSPVTLQPGREYTIEVVQDSDPVEMGDASPTESEIDKQLVLAKSVLETPSYRYYVSERSAEHIAYIRSVPPVPYAPVSNTAPTTIPASPSVPRIFAPLVRFLDVALDGWLREMRDFTNNGQQKGGEGMAVTPTSVLPGTLVLPTVSQLRYLTSNANITQLLWQQKSINNEECNGKGGNQAEDFSSASTQAPDILFRFYELLASIVRIASPTSPTSAPTELPFLASFLASGTLVQTLQLAANTVLHPRAYDWYYSPQHLSLTSNKRADGSDRNESGATTRPIDLLLSILLAVADLNRPDVRGGFYSVLVNLFSMVLMHQERKEYSKNVSNATPSASSTPNAAIHFIMDLQPLLMRLRISNDDTDSIPAMLPSPGEVDTLARCHLFLSKMCRVLYETSALTFPDASDASVDELISGNTASSVNEEDIVIFVSLLPDLKEFILTTMDQLANEITRRNLTVPTSPPTWGAGISNIINVQSLAEESLSWINQLIESVS